MKKKILLIGGILVLLVLAVVFYYMYVMNQSFYKPGSLKNSSMLESPLSPPVQNDSSDFWQLAEDIEIYHFSSGDGRNVLVIHGGPGYPFRDPITALKTLEDRYKFNYFDQRGCGRSSRPIDSFSSPNYYENTQVLERRLGLSTQLADIERIRRILGEEKLILIGHSFGGFLASLYAVEFPEHVDGLILVAPATMLVMPNEHSDLFDSILEGLPPDQLDSYMEFLDEYFDFRNIFNKTEADLVQLQSTLGQYYQVVMDTRATNKQGEAGGWMVWAMYFSMGKRHDYRDALTNISAPVMVIHGADDLQSEAASREYADLIPNAEFIVIDNAGHFVYDDQPDLFSRYLESFLEDIN